MTWEMEGDIKYKVGNVSLTINIWKEQAKRDDCMWSLHLNLLQSFIDSFYI